MPWVYTGELGSSTVALVWANLVTTAPSLIGRAPVHFASFAQSSTSLPMISSSIDLAMCILVIGATSVRHRNPLESLESAQLIIMVIYQGIGQSLAFA
jgi:hypothetical protein